MQSRSPKISLTSLSVPLEDAITDVAPRPSMPHCCFIAPIYSEKKEISPSSRRRCSEKEPLPPRKEQLWDVEALKLNFKNSLPWWAEPGAEGETPGVPGRWWGISCRPALPARRKPWCWSWPSAEGPGICSWSLYKHQGILTIDLGRLGVVFGTVIGERRKRTKKGGDSQRVSEQELSEENLAGRW